jgi:hypothetical protein
MREDDMKKEMNTHRHLPSRRPRGPLLAGCALLVVVFGAAPAAAQLPATDPPGYPGSTVYSDNFATGSVGSKPSFWEETHWDPYGDDGNWELRSNSSIGEIDGPCAGDNGRWTGDGSYYLREDDSNQDSEGQSILFPWSTLLGLPFPTNPASDFRNIRVEFDFYMADDPESRVGAVWRAADVLSPSRVIDSGYLFMIRDVPDDGSTSGLASYSLIKRYNNTDYTLATGTIDTSSDPGWPSWSNQSVLEDHCYRLRVDYYCGYIRAQVKQFSCSGASCDETTWHTVVEFTDDFVTNGPELPVGTGKTGWIGMFSGSNGSSIPDQYYDNFDIWSWGDTCGTPVPTFTPTGTPGPTSTPTPTPIPGATDTPTPTPGPVTPTPTPNDGWTPYADTDREHIAFKLLYEGSLLDYVAVPSASEPRIDVAFQPPTAADRYSYCEGWDLAVDLPDPILDSELDTVRSHLERTSSAIDYVNDDASNFLRWQENFEEDDTLAGFNPVPLAASGRTPINNALLDAFDWYVDQVEPGGRWVDDPLQECRKWYVVLITDGAESCVPDPSDGDPSLADVQRPGGDGGTYACEDPLGNTVIDGAAYKFSDPLTYGGVDVEPLKIFTIGFALAAAAPGELTCISDVTDGEYYRARNAAELRNALYEVLNQLNTEDERTFSPFKVSPPPSGKAGPAEQQDFLVVYPLFQPIDGSSLWTGNLYGFKLDPNQTSLPADANCEVDRSQLVTNPVTTNQWDANARLNWQLQNLAVRPVFMGQYDGVAGTWSRHDLTEIPTDATLRLYFGNRMNEPGGVTDLEIQEVVNFVRGLWMDDADPLAPAPVDWDTTAAGNQPRPAGAPVLGDIYHSQPTVISPPNRSMFFFDYGYGDAHNYAAFMERHEMRRRVVLVGANDGLVHAFDGGIWDRDRVTDRAGGDDYDQQHDLGDGSELFTYLPHAVMPGLYELTYGDYQQYLVDGPISVSDVFIDHDGDSNREWRTVALFTMRRGGRGVAALDITQPDPIGTDFVPDVPSDQFPGCLDGTDSDCDGEYPKVLWEFEDTADADGNCGGLPNCSPYWDLGWTWSKPAIARIPIYNGVDPSQPDDVFVAFFGGGWSQEQKVNDGGTPLDPSDDYLVDTTGRHFYAVDISTGAVLKKWAMGEYGIPGSPTALDSDIDGFHDRIYFGDSDGSIFRLEYPGPSDPAAVGVDLGVGHLPTRIFDFRPASADGGFPDRQQFFTRPVTVPALFGADGYTWALAMGSGDRANLEFYDPDTSPIDHFFFVLDVGDDVTRGANSLVALNYDELDGTQQCEGRDTALNPGNNDYGWYLSLRPHEKVVFDATVVNGHVLFPTFDPTPGVFATHNTPDECVSTSTTPTPTPTGTPSTGIEETPIMCKAAGLGRSYDLWFTCGMGDYSENNDIYTGVEDYTIGGTTYVTYTESHFTEGETEEFPNVTGHVVTNWRQD